MQNSQICKFIDICKWALWTFHNADIKLEKCLIRVLVMHSAHICRMHQKTHCKGLRQPMLLQEGARLPLHDPLQASLLQTTGTNLLWYSALFVPRTMSLCTSPSFTFTLTRMYLKVPSGSISTSGTLARASAIVIVARVNAPEALELLRSWQTDNRRAWCVVYFGSARQLHVLKRQTVSAAPHQCARGRPLTAARSTVFMAERRGVCDTEIEKLINGNTKTHE